MKVLHALHNFPPEFVGGTEGYVAALAQEQARGGHEVRVLCGSERPGAGEAREEWQGIEVLRLRRDPAFERYSVDFRVPRLRRRYGALLAQERPDVVHVHHYLNLGVPLAQDAVERGIPAVITLHDYTAVCPRFFLMRPDGGFCGDGLPVPLERCLDCCAAEFDGSRAELLEEFRLRRAFFAAELAAAAVLLFPSEKARSCLLGTGILPLPPRSEVLPLGLLRRLEPAPRAPGPEGKLRLVFFGNVAPVKGVDLLLQALAGMDGARRARVSLLLLGRSTDEALERRLAELKGDLDLRREHAFDAARLEKLPAEADAAVFPGTAAETYSLVVDEALALGLPVIVSDRGAAAERAGPAAAVVPAGDAAALCAVIERLLDAPGRLDEMRRAAAGRVSTIAEHAARLQAVYERARGRGACAAAPAPSGLDGERLEARDRVVARLVAERAERGRAVAADPPFDATFRFLPLRDFRSVPDGRVVVLAPHPDDEVIGAGGAIALHAGRGDEVVVVHLTDGAGGDREARQGGAIARVRREEARAAGQVLGVSRTLGLDFPDGGLRPEGAFLAGLCALLETLRPRVLYVPSPFEHHPDHRAAYLLAAAALEHLAPAPAVFLYEVNEPQPAGFLLDVTPVLALKDQALCCFSSQRAYLDVAAKTLHANRARTVNVDLPEVEAAEAYLEIEPARMREWVGFAAAARAFREGAAPRAAPDAALDPARPRAPVSAVIATWNKRDDLRENLRALERQTIPPAEIIVVDNCSKDGTADMIREEFPEVRLLSSSSDQTGACETFNMGFKAATQPYVAIMDDDVVAPPAWLETLVRRMEQEPPSTAMISSKVVEPGMPDEFIRSERVNRERYMATFRGCGTLARSEVLRRAGYYDEVFFIYGNERDLAARVLGLGCRILQLPDAEIFHKTPFGMKAGRRSLYFHVRNFWLYAFKNCSWRQILAAAFALGLKGLGRRRGGHASDATGTIGLERSLKDTRGGLWIACRATFAALLLLPHCLRNRKVCRADDFEPPLA